MTAYSLASLAARLQDAREAEREASADLAAAVCVSVSEGMTVTEAATLAGVTRRTIYAWLAEPIRAALDEARG